MHFIAIGERRAVIRLLPALLMIGASMARQETSNVTIDYYSILTPTSTSTVTSTTPPFTQDIFATTVGIAAVTVVPQGETVYAETIVLTLDALVSGTSTFSTLFSTPTSFVYTFEEDASRFSASPTTITVTLPSGAGEAEVSIFDQLVCTGATGAPATCFRSAMQPVTEPGPPGPPTTETFSAVRTPIFTITSGAAWTTGPPVFKLGLMVVIVGMVFSML